MKFHIVEFTMLTVSAKMSYFTKKGRQMNSTNKFKLTVPLIKTSQTLIYKIPPIKTVTKSQYYMHLHGSLINRLRRHTKCAAK